MSAGHDHAHDHSHAPANFNRAFAIGIVLNIVFVAIEAFYGWKVNSLALLADAGHNLSDVAGLVLAWGGALAGKLRPDARHTYGWKRGTILAAFANALLLLMAIGALAWEALGRLLSPEPLMAAGGVTIMVVAGIGIVINTATALLFMRGGENDLNIRGAFLHMAADALVSAGVVIAGALTLWMGWVWLDPVVSLVIAAVILIGTWSLFRQSLHLLFDGVPDSVDPQAVYDCLAALPGVARVHDLHIWAMGTSQVALTAHLVMPHGQADDAFLKHATDQLHARFEITHVTLQVMKDAFTTPCAEPPDIDLGARPVADIADAHPAHRRQLSKRAGSAVIVTMNTSAHPFFELFAQLGLPSDEQDIRRFIADHSPLAADIALADAPFWTKAQADFLRDELLEDADWAEVIDQLNVALRAT